ncbi:hypothetical protein SAY86_004794 [Trapa natans]|uniref:Uncharacterized protein n=1 Tax=Trapa natans TaxID=22666 RepID=A0AAN7RI91_TRANT|nr:hypothetical protein SAY86_004794 [Trapa natans]
MPFSSTPPPKSIKKESPLVTNRFEKSRKTLARAIISSFHFRGRSQPVPSSLARFPSAFVVLPGAPPSSSQSCQLSSGCLSRSRSYSSCRSLPSVVAGGSRALTGLRPISISVPRCHRLWCGSSFYFLVFIHKAALSTFSFSFIRLLSRYI